MKFLFVGECPSEKAIRMGVSWKDGRLAAKSLFEALRACDLDPAQQLYVNAYLSTEPREICTIALRWITEQLDGNTTVVALGKLASRALTLFNIEHVKLIHPAARGAIRKRELYISHVKSVLEPLLIPYRTEK